MKKQDRKRIKIDLVDIAGEEVPTKPDLFWMGKVNSRDKGARESHYKISNPNTEVIEDYCDFHFSG